MRKLLILSVLAVLSLMPARADEGMWIPILIEKFNIHIMQENGFKLTAEDIYSINQASMKDAVMIFGGGCTGEFISSEGLLITNHHCGFGAIRGHSTVEHDYLTDGFWAMSKEEELVTPGLTVTIMKYMEDVSEQVLDGVGEDMTESERAKIIGENIRELTKKAVEGTHYSASVRPFYMGNQYFLFVNETFRDVRLVGAPPSSIGKFGGETDNWTWPRHTGDFSIFRVYANGENEPSAYKEDNKPYKPAHHFPVSLKGVEEGDFTMVFGYPGGTSQYVPSFHIEMLTQDIYPKMIDIRTQKLEIMMADMDTDPLIRLQYASKKSGLANSWKRWQGEIRGLENLNTIENKKKFEEGFQKWAESNPNRAEMYGGLLPEYEEVYDALKGYNFIQQYTGEAFGSRGAEAVSMAGYMDVLVQAVEEKEKDFEGILNRIRGRADRYFADYNEPTDRKIFAAVMKLYDENAPKKYTPQAFTDIKEQFGGDFEKAAAELYAKSPFTSKEALEELLSMKPRKAAKVIKKDPFYRLSTSISQMVNQQVRPQYRALSSELDSLDRIYMAAQMEYDEYKRFYPDANFTLRVAYGKVAGYKSKDAVQFKHYTTLDGIMEKDNPEIYDYDVPDKLRQLYEEKDYGRYEVAGSVPVCFIATNHTTGGNSGSPVINAEGHLIGVNFDRAWEGIQSDLEFNPKQSRNISLDIRYALFIIDKMAGAGWLLDEMTIIE